MPRKIVVVDDDMEIRALVSEGLKIAGYEVFEASDGVEGLKVVRAEKPDVIILDLAMPHMNGYEVCKAIKGDPELASIKIIINSAKSYPVDMKAAKAAGAETYLIKPYPIKNLIEILARLWDNPPS